MSRLSELAGGNTGHPASRGGGGAPRVNTARGAALAGFAAAATPAATSVPAAASASASHSGRAARAIVLVAQPLTPATLAGAGERGPSDGRGADRAARAAQ